MANEDQKGC